MSVVAGVAPDPGAATPGTSRRRTDQAPSRGPGRRPTHPAPSRGPGRRSTDLARSSGPGRPEARTRHLRAVTTSDLREHIAAVPEVARSWRLTRRGRAVVLGLLVALLTAGAVGFGAAQAIGASTAPTDRRVEVIVGEGDTLWSIAASVAPQGDRTETVQRIREANDLGNAHIEPGQQLVVPVPAP